MYLYDTNVISELRKKNPNQNVLNFHQFVNDNGYKILLSSIVFGEVLKGISYLKNRGDITQATLIQYWYDKELKPIEHLALNFDLSCAKVWGNLMAKNLHNPIDKQLCATAIVFDLILVTRNVKHIEDTGVKYINPFEFQP